MGVAGVAHRHRGNGLPALLPSMRYAGWGASSTSAGWECDGLARSSTSVSAISRCVDLTACSIEGGYLVAQQDKAEVDAVLSTFSLRTRWNPFPARAPLSPQWIS